MIVGVHQGFSTHAEHAITERGGRIATFYEPGEFFVVELPGHSGPPEWARSMGEDPSIRFAEPDLEIEADDVTPNDPRWSSQWGLQQIGLSKAWDTSTGSGNVTVAVLDTGVDYTHQDIGVARMWRNPSEVPDGADNDRNGFVDDLYGTDCRNKDGDPMDDNDHGTHVAGIIAASTNNATGVAGADWNVKIMALKFLDSASRGSTFDTIRCLDYAVAKGARVVNASWGGGGYSQALRDAIARARAAGVLIVTSAGNDAINTDAATAHYPSSYDLDNVISVAATGSTDMLASFSNYGPMSVDIAAPGTGIVSTLRGNTYGTKQGTSMAAPHVTGAATLMLAAFPGISYLGVIDRLYGSADRVPGLAGKVATGRLNVARAIETDTRPPGAPSLTALPTLATRSSVTLAWTSPSEDGPLGSGAVAAYALRFRLAGTAAWIDASPPAPSPPGTPQAATVPALRPARSYEFMLVARDNVGNSSSSPTLVAATRAGVEILFDDFEAGTSWTKSGLWAFAPDRFHSPVRTWSDSPAGPYANGVDQSVVSPAFSLVGARNPTLALWHRYNLQRDHDSGAVEISTDGGSTWKALATFTGASDWSATEIDLRPYAGAPSVRIRFRLLTDALGVHEGWLFDDVLISADP